MTKQNQTWFKAIVQEHMEGVNLALGAQVWVTRVKRFGCDRDDILVAWNGQTLNMSVTNAKTHLLLDKGKRYPGPTFGPSQQPARQSRADRLKQKAKDFDTGYRKGSDEDGAIRDLVERGISLKALTDCPRCGGSGKFGKKGICYCCRGRGRVTNAARALHFIGIAKAAM